MVGPRRQRKHRMQRVEPSMLACHVVRGRRHRAEWRTPEHEFGAAVPHEISQVGVPVGKLLDLERAGEIEAGQRQTGEMFAKVGVEPNPVECFPDVVRI